MAPIDFPSLIRRLTDEGGIAAIARNPRAQFGTPQRPRLGARLMPERLVPTNAYTESNIRLLTIIANAGPRYGPVQIKNGQISASFDRARAERPGPRRDPRVPGAEHDAPGPREPERLRGHRAEPRAHGPQ
jgi:hypothetical protein